MLLSAVLIVLLVGLLRAIWIRSQFYFKPVGFPDGPDQIPIFGNLLEFGKSPLTAMTTWKRKYGQIVGLRLGDFRTVILNDYDLIRKAFSNPSFNGRPEFLPALLFTGGGGHGTLTSEGDPWDVVRRFTVKNLGLLGFGKKSMENIFLCDVESLLAGLEKEAGSGKINFKNRFYVPAINHLWYILMGHDIPKGKRDFFQTSLTELNKALWQPIGSAIWFLPWLAKCFPSTTALAQLKKTLPILQNLVRDEAERHKDSFMKDDSSGVVDDLMDAFLNEIAKAENSPESHFHKEEGEHHMRGMILNLFVTAAEAVTNTMNWTLLYLALNERAQDLLAEEVDSVIGPHRSPSLSDMSNMPYTKAVMQEVLRISSTSPFSNFQMTTEDVAFEGCYIPKGTTVIANLYGIHHDEGYYPEPESFRPERFLNSGSASTAPLIPFSVGLRTCIGQTFAKNEVFLFLTCLVQRFRFVWDPSVAKPSETELTEGCHVSIFRFAPQFELLLQSRNPMAVVG